MDEEDDPIAKSLKERERPQTAAPRHDTAGKKDTEEEKKGVSKPAPKDRPQTAKPAPIKEEEKKVPKTTAPSTAGKKPASKDEGDADDPIAQSLAQRVKAGGITAVVG